MEDDSKDVAVVTKILEDMKQHKKQSEASAIFFTESEGNQNVQNKENATKHQQEKEAKA